jgi:uncharacterized phage protein gp47/JayE
MLALLPIDKLITAPTKAEVEGSIYALLSASGLPITAWQEGGVYRTLIAVLATVIAGFLGLVAKANRSNFLDLCEGDTLTHRAKQNYDVTRFEATYAQTDVTVDNATGGSYTFDPGDFVLEDSVSGALWANLQTFTIHALQKGVAVSMQALESGSGSNALPGRLTVMVSPIEGLTMTNNLATYGLDEESDSALRQRCRDSLGRLSPLGAEAAYTYFAKSARRQTDDSPVGVKRVWVSPSGVPVRVYVAADTGEITGDAEDPETDLGAVAYDVTQYACPNPITCTVASATKVPRDVEVDVYFDKASGLTNDTVNSIVVMAMRDFIKAVPIGGHVIGGSGKFRIRALEQAIKAASPHFIQAEVTDPSSDVTLAEGEILTLAEPVIHPHAVTL